MLVKNLLAKKIAEDIVSLQKVWVQVVKEKRGGQFRIADWRPMLQAKTKLFPSKEQSKEVFDLYIASANSAYSVLSELTDHVLPEDEPWLEHYQTTAVFEILYEYDRSFRRAALKVVEAVEKSDDLIEEELFAKFSGRYGPTWIADYVATPGSFLNLYKRILENVKIKTEYKWTFANAVSAARNTSCSVMFGAKFLDIVSKTNDIKAAVKAEKERMKQMWLSPVETQIQIMKEVGQNSFDYQKCLLRFKEKIYESTVKAAESKVHYANLSLIPFWGAGDFHHISQTTYNICKGDVEMAILESVTMTLEKTLKKAQEKGKLKDPYKIPTYEVAAGAVAYIMRMDGFTSEMVNELFLKRYYNLLLENPAKFRFECMTDEFVNFLTQGEYIIEKTPRGLDCKVNGVEVDLSPIDNNEILQNPQRYSWPECPITARFSGLLKFADEPFHLFSDPLICLYATELIALNPQKPYLPFLYCKKCASSRLLPARCRYCLAEKPIT